MTLEAACSLSATPVVFIAPVVSVGVSFIMSPHFDCHQWSLWAKRSHISAVSMHPRAQFSLRLRDAINRCMLTGNVLTLINQDRKALPNQGKKWRVLFTKTFPMNYHQSIACQGGEPVRWSISKTSNIKKPWRKYIWLLALPNKFNRISKCSGISSIRYWA